MPSTLKIDLNIDKHKRPTLVIACPSCQHELTHHLETLLPDSTLNCEKCNSGIGVTRNDLLRAQDLYTRILIDDGGKT
ncbi:MAG: hypothetical protein CGU29_11895 [Candidatus Dactylopiibacterium carminicum]|nr:hypothetical protein [Candidatus Dactylopiibacterium carminicum]PAS92354.1 MAG: hypothetical protein CGU29_11895 [Candidatus Dactylopiibacterium carminicum]PAS98382.1 MAG: hypothetical protein BSR46_12355 [Candidatus Dactylopiibacterium carminicum]